MRLIHSIRVVALLLPVSLGGLSASAQPASPAREAKADGGLAIVLVSRGAGQSTVVGAAVAIRANGILLTPYRLVKDARSVQVRLKTGEIYDRVQMLGTDARRDVAAIKITGSLSPLSTASGSVRAGESFTMVSLSSAGLWTASKGAVSADSMAEQVPGAGKGYRVIQFTPGQDTSIGGILLDAQGNAFGLVTGPGFAVPVDSVQGLGDGTPVKTFASGASLELPAVQAERPVTRDVPAKSSEATPVSRATATVSEPKAAEASVKEDRRSLLHNLKTIYVDATGSKGLGSNEMKQALRDNSSLLALGIEVADQEDQADAILALDPALAGDYPFEVRSPQGTMLLRGRAGGLSSAAGAQDIATYLAQLIRPFRTTSKKQGR
jgi:hypothetical protein